VNKNLIINTDRKEFENLIHKEGNFYWENYRGYNLFVIRPFGSINPEYAHLSGYIVIPDDDKFFNKELRKGFDEIRKFIDPYKSIDFAELLFPDNPNSWAIGKSFAYGSSRSYCTKESVIRILKNLIDKMMK
jgi:hypothetical protein